jgi:uncharacterized membrane protein (DUF485 family)
MKKINTIFQLLVALLFVVALVFFLAFDSMRNAFNIQELTAGKVVVWLLVGASLFLISWLLDNIYINGLKKDMKKLEVEKTELKAKLYDRDQEARASSAPTTPTATAKSSKIQRESDFDSEEEKEISRIRPRQNYK